MGKSDVSGNTLIRAVPATGFHASFPMRPPRQPPLRRATPPVFPRKTSAGGFGLAQGIAFTEEHALFRFRQFLHRFDAFGDGAHGPKLWHALAASGKGMEKTRHPRTNTALPSPQFGNESETPDVTNV